MENSFKKLIDMKDVVAEFNFFIEFLFKFDLTDLLKILFSKSADEGRVQFITHSLSFFAVGLHVGRVRPAQE